MWYVEHTTCYFSERVLREKFLDLADWPVTSPKCEVRSIMPEIWVELENFPGYSISDHGRVRSEKSQRILARTINRSGVVFVSPFQDKRQVSRSVSLLVAQAFLPPPKNPTYNTPINLDGDRSNNHVNNLAWRPRWFAIKYARQFHEYFNGRNMRVTLIGTGEELTCWTAAVKYGLLYMDVLISAGNHGKYMVFPTCQRFTVSW